MKKTADTELRNMGIVLDDLEQPIGTLSGGQRQCVAIARAVYFGARVLILDEPTAALGVKQSGVVLKYIAAARERGLGVIFITHNPHHAYMVGDHFSVLRLGTMELSASRDQVSLAEAAELLGSSPEEVLSDLRVLFMCGLPGGLPDDLIDVDLDAIETDSGAALADGVIRVGNADYLARPMRLSPTEASAVVVALHTLRDGSPADVRASLAALDAVLRAEEHLDPEYSVRQSVT